MQLRNAGIKAMGAYLPAKALGSEAKSRLLNFLQNGTLLPEAYLQEIEANKKALQQVHLLKEACARDRDTVLSKWLARFS